MNKTKQHIKILIDLYLVTQAGVILARLDLVFWVQGHAVPQVARPVHIAEWLQIMKMFSYYTPISGLSWSFFRVVVVNILHKAWNSLKI